MATGDELPLWRRYMNNAALLLKTTFPGNALKSVARGAPCSLRQAQRMLTTGRIPVRLRERVFVLIDEAIGQRRAELDGVEYALRVMALEEGKATRAPSKAAADAAPSDMAERQD